MTKKEQDKIANTEFTYVNVAEGYQTCSIALLTRPMGRATLLSCVTADYLSSLKISLSAKTPAVVKLLSARDEIGDCNAYQYECPQKDKCIDITQVLQL